MHFWASPTHSSVFLYLFSLNFNFINKHISLQFDFFGSPSFSSTPQQCISPLSPMFFAFGIGGCICLHGCLHGDSQALAYSWPSGMQSVFASFSTLLEGKERKLRDALTVCVQERPCEHESPGFLFSFYST